MRIACWSFERSVVRWPVEYNSFMSPWPGASTILGVNDREGRGLSRIELRRLCVIKMRK